MASFKNKTPEKTPQKPGVGYSLTKKECPRCGAKLYSYIADSAMGQNYLCGKCGYLGPVGLNPASKERFDTAVKDMKKFMKESNKQQ